MADAGVADLAAWLAPRRAWLNAQRFRGVVWIAAPAETARARAERWLAAADWRSPLWVGAAPPARDGLVTLSAGRARSQLGREHDVVVFDAVSSDSGFDPDAFGALSGTVEAGGWLVLLTPAAWAEAAVPASDAVVPDSVVPDAVVPDAVVPDSVVPDSDYARLAHWPHDGRSLSARYLQRIAGHLRGAVDVASWPASAPLPYLSLFHLSLPEVAGAPSATTDPDDIVQDADCLTPDQAAAVSRLVRLRRRRPVVLVADRGRGKSAALGIAAARRLANGESRLWITAASAPAVASVFDRLGALLPQGRRQGQRFTVTWDGQERVVEWLAPDRVLEALEALPARDAAPTLLVDEAAMLPAARLAQWLARFPRIAFATTVHGYEGTGRGFDVRFRERLERDTPDWHRLTLETPVRWAPGDPLERLTRELLCLDADIDFDLQAESGGTDVTEFVWLDRTALARDETRLRRVFGLLVQAHYRTAPSDLRQLLDGPDLRLLAASHAERVIGVCAVQQEGGFDAVLADEIHRGQRRPRGHLMAQSLSLHGGAHDMAMARWWRIMRIAVHPSWRRQGLGAAMIERVVSAAAASGIDRLGVSFGTDPGLMRFWRALSFASVRLGLRPEAASGEPALMMARALSERARLDIDALAADHRALLPDLLAGPLRDASPLHAAWWLHEGGTSTADDCRGRLVWFAAGGGELALVRPWLRQAWLDWWRRQPLAMLPLESSHGSAKVAPSEDPLAPARLEPVVAALFQYREMALYADGRQTGERVARALARRLLDDDASAG